MWELLELTAPPERLHESRLELALGKCTDGERAREPQ